MGNAIDLAAGVVIVTWAVFLLVKGVNALRRTQAEAPAVPPASAAGEKLLVEIRDLLKQRVSRPAGLRPSVVRV